MSKFIAAFMFTIFCTFSIPTTALSANYNWAQLSNSNNAPITLIASKQQCLRSCSTWNNQCRNLVTEQGDKDGWNDQTRNAAYATHCAPHVSACQNRCGPIGPGECRVMADGEEICS